MDLKIMLDAASWEDEPSGWKCPALVLPGFELKQLLVSSLQRESIELDSSRGYVIWKGEPRKRPTVVRLLMSVLEQKCDQGALQYAVEMKNIELRGRESRWKKISILGTLGIGILGVATTVGMARYKGSGCSGETKTPLRAGSYQCMSDTTLMKGCSVSSSKSSKTGCTRITFFSPRHDAVQLHDEFSGCLTRRGNTFRGEMTNLFNADPARQKKFNKSISKLQLSPITCFKGRWTLEDGSGSSFVLWR